MRPNQVEARLKTLRDQGVGDVNKLRLLYIQESWLRRIAVSPYRERLILKGGLLLYALYNRAYRPTRDIDFLGRQLPATPEEMTQMSQTIAAISLDDGVVFDATSLSVSIIREENVYGGMRVQLLGMLGAIRQPLQFDIGFGDVVTPPPVEMNYPTLFGEALSVKAYSLDTVVAEKFQAMADLSITNSRSKDFYDLYQLATTQGFEAQQLSETIRQTFRRRNTSLEKGQAVFETSFTTDSTLNLYWNNYLKREKLEAPSFPEAMALLQRWLEPVIDGEARGHWDFEKRNWL
jgi:predicted nucleotidyltransferase component of viral defense system